MAHVKVSGTWRESDRQFVRVGGAWRNIDETYVRVGGNWRLSWSDFPFEPGLMQGDGSTYSITDSGQVRLHAARSTVGYALATAVTTRTYNFDNIQTLELDWGGSSSANMYGYVIVSPNKMGDDEDYVRRGEMRNNFVGFNWTMNVSSVTGDNYIRIHAFTSNYNYYQTVTISKVSLDGLQIFPKVQ